MKKKIFTLMCALCTLALSVSAQYVTSFSWSGWLNPPDDQKETLGPCNAFASVSATEAAYRLFYNSQTMANGATVNFSNQLLYSFCSKPNSAPTFTYIASSLDFIRDYGIYHEGLYRYFQRPGNTTGYWDQPALRGASCDIPDGYNVAPDLQERVKILTYTKLTFNPSGSGEYNVANDNDLRRILLKKGPIIINLAHSSLHGGATHAYVLAGWNNNASGKAVWILYDSWAGSPTVLNFADLLPTLNLAYVINIYNGLTSSKGKTVSCTDKDQDGYYFWGLGPKPSTCPSGSSSIEDEETDNNALLGARNAYGVHTPLPIPIHWINVAEQTGKTGLCPSQTYVIKATTSPTTTITGYSWTKTGGITIVSTSGNTATISTSSSYTSGQVGVKLQNSGGWSAYKYASFSLAPVIDYNTITVKEQYNRTTLCPNTNYIFTATGPSGVLQWDWYIRGSITEVSRSGNTITVRTSSTFSYACVAAKARNCAGWSSFKYSQNYYVCSGLKKAGKEEVSDASADQTFKVFPNPIEQGKDLSIAISDMTGSVKVFDVAGVEMEVRVFEMNSEGAKISTSALKPGIYFIRVSTTHGETKFKLLVK